jgi:hypothetical protein
MFADDLEYPDCYSLYQDDTFPQNIPGGGNPIAPNGGRMTTRTTGSQYPPDTSKIRKGKPLPLKKAKKPALLKDAQG